VSGGPYTTVASPTSTTFTDTALTNGTTYYYVVTAVNSGGESGNSTETSATPQPSAPAP
jgi:fibronectin type 3 domain-containing protein